jgi:hypothetical protein
MIYTTEEPTSIVFNDVKSLKNPWLAFGSPSARGTHKVFLGLLNNDYKLI